MPSIEQLKHCADRLGIDYINRQFRPIFNPKNKKWTPTNKMVRVKNCFHTLGRSMKNRTRVANSVIESFKIKLTGMVYDDAITIEHFLANACEWIKDQNYVVAIRLLFVHDFNSERSLIDELFASPPSGETDWPSVSTSNFTQVPSRNRSHVGTQIYGYNSCSIAVDDSLAFFIQSIFNPVEKGILKSLLDMLREKGHFAFRYKEERRFERVLGEIVQTHIRANLQPSHAWSAIANHATKFLPDFAPLKIQLTSTRCQVLTHSKDDRYLTLRAASTADDQDTTLTFAGGQLLKIDDVICGIPLLKQLEVLIVNPTLELTEKYGAYLFPDQTVKSEVVTLLKFNDESIGVLNFEHPEEAAFGTYTVDMIKRAAAALSPFVAALVRREQRQRSKNIGNLYVIGNMLERMNSDLNHKVANSVLKVRLLCESLIVANASDPGIVEELGQIKNEVDTVQQRSESFLRDVPSYLRPGHQHLKPIIEDAVRDAVVECRAEPYQIEFDTKGQVDAYVFASLLLRENLKNLLVNSILAVKERVDNDSVHAGIVSIQVERLEVEDLQARVGSAPPRVYITITDNGVGCAPELLPRIREYAFTTRRDNGGTGHGLSAAMDYVQSIFGGEFTYGNVVGGGFFVRFYILVYDQQLDSL